eukprot:scpid78662/ scgid28582/ 
MAQRVKNGGKSKGKDGAPVPPDRKKHDDEVLQLNKQIEDKQAALKAFGRSGVDRDAQRETSAQLDKLYREGSKIRSQKEACVEKRHGIDTKIREVNNVIAKKSDEGNKMSATLRYKSADRVDEAITRLENRKQNRQLSAQEETDLQTELKELTDSKPIIIAYNQCRKDIEAERERHTELRQERDAMTEELSKLRSSEDETHADIDKLRSRIDEEKRERKSQNEDRDSLQRDLDQLYSQKRDKLTAFRTAQNDFHIHELDARDAAAAKRDEERRKARQERALDKEGRQRERLESEAANDPNIVHRQTCASLINYLSRMAVVAEANGTASSGSSAAAAPDLDSLTSVRGGGEAKPGMFLSRKTREDDYSGADSLFAGKGKKGKKGKKGSAAAAAGKASARAIKHNTVVLQQFLSVGVSAPPSASAVPAAVEELRQKEAQYTRSLIEKHGKNAGIEVDLDSLPPTAAATAVLTNGVDGAATSNGTADAPTAAGNALSNGDVAVSAAAADES